MRFEWDKNKAVSNLAKHQVSFEEAKIVFNDPLYIDFCGPDHSDKAVAILLLVSRARSTCCSVLHTEKRFNPPD